MSEEELRPIATCQAADCGGCDVKDEIQCHFKMSDLIYFYVIVSPSFLLGGWGLLKANPWWLFLWILLTVGFFLAVETRVLCSHCPHWAEEGKTLTCWANYGIYKLWKHQPGPMVLWEKAVLLAGFAFVWGFPLLPMIQRAQVFLLLVYLLSVASFFMSVRRNLCVRCMNFSCPLNRVDEDARRRFLYKNPSAASPGVDKPGDGSAE